MSSAVWPTLPGLEWSVMKTPSFATNVKTAASGKEVRTSMWSYPVWTLEMSYEFLRDDATAELTTIVGFFLQRLGQGDDFNFLDPEDNTAVNVQVGIGDGTNRFFQLAKSYAGFVEPVFRVNGTPVVKVNGVTKATPADYTIDSEGLITFATAPTNTHPVTWSGGYYYRVRFQEDSMELEKFLYKLWRLKKVTLRTIK